MKKIIIDKSITVAEFIKILEQFPQDLPVRVSYDRRIEISIDDKYYDGDCANPDCPVIQALLIN